MRIAIIGLRLFVASLQILGPSPSNQVAFDGSTAFIYECTCSDVTNGILKNLQWDTYWKDAKCQL